MSKRIEANDVTEILEFLHQRNSSGPGNIPHKIFFRRPGAGQKVSDLVVPISRVIFYGNDGDPIVVESSDDYAKVVLAYLTIPGNGLVWAIPGKAELLKQKAWMDRLQFMGVEIQGHSALARKGDDAGEVAAAVA